MRARQGSRGTTLLTSLMLMAVLAVVVASVLTYATISHNRATEISRLDDRQRCVEEGLQLAKSYFGQNGDLWNSYLGSPAQYNPIRSTWNVTPADPMDPALRMLQPALFADLDGDGPANPDVYLYIRDNADDAPAKWNADNDGIVIVGAMCISATMNPGQSTRGASCASSVDCGASAVNDGVLCIKPSGATMGVCTAPLVMEAMVEYLGGGGTRYKEDNCGSKGTGNCN